MIAQYAMHNDDDWRLTDDAEDSWIGSVCDQGGDEVIDLSDIAVTYGWKVAHRIAAAIIKELEQVRV